ncbi:Protein of unknown function [Salinimicrobium catena]|uniref:DUF2911 domain-containing protein n=1 Tax=Salinimicrobium catena TaxID=390640 RepID=A0A1H5NCH6_9FLAO|nr:DUF2911 domain-containing protein [Salinimicrobium catena]SDL42664.1 Protein of unknown function [Salinimicrobium catena]SEE99180.1 Protein of unknown function [Salinimicrobium catena]
MKKAIKRTFLGMFILGGVIMLSYFIFKTNTKSFSPEDTVTFQQDELILEVFYNRPYKKERQIFGGLVPYGEVWRTGANEATTFTTNKDIYVDGSLLPAGKYTLWTIPMEESWKVIFNSEMYPWGITADEKPSRVPQYDVLTVEVPSKRIDEPVEQFTIDFTTAYDFIQMNFVWDRTLVRVPIKDVEKVEKFS